MNIKLISLATALFMSLSLVGCSQNNKTSKVVETGNLLVSELSNIENNFSGAFDNIPNLTADKEIRFILPNDINEIYSYTSRPSLEYDMEKYHDDFLKLFEYLFPNHKIDNDYFLYYGENSKIEYDEESNVIQDLNKVEENYEKLVSGAEGRAYFVYDETWYGNLQEWNSPVCLEIGNPMGYGYTTIGKGKTVELSDLKITDSMTGEIRYPRLGAFSPVDYMKIVASYWPESTESYKLSDKEMQINEAVSFYENYVNTLPYPKEKNCRTVVRSVDVFEVANDIYGFYFYTNKEYLGVQFDYMKSGTVHSIYENYSPEVGFGAMVESNDVDIIGGTYLLETAEDITTYNKVISFEEAAKLIGSNLSDNVTFEVQVVELIYTTIPAQDENGYIDIDNPSSKIEPSWKFTLYNPNDQLVYVCYVDAVDGKNFRYYKIFE